mgnify:FL=1
MADRSTVKMEGFADLERNLNKFQEKIARKGTVAAAGAGASVFMTAIRARAQAAFKAHTGRLFRGIAVVSKIYWHGLAGATV